MCQFGSDADPMPEVFVTVRGGVAYLAEAPESVEVHIIDYDDLNDDFVSAFNRLSPVEQAFYRRTEAAATKLAERNAI